MFHISRVFISNLGSPSARFAGNIFNFSSEGKRKAVHNAVVGTNGRGKTTALALIFSVFEPQVVKFVQYTQNQKHRFHHYLADSPGIVAVELAEANGLAPRKIVVGWVHSIDRYESGKERIFFSFDVSRTKTLDLLPWPGTSAQATVRDWKGANDWVKAWKADVSGGDVGMVVHDGQERWKAHLREERGIDLDLITTQMELAHAEGGLAKMFEKMNDDGKTVAELARMLGLDDKASKVIEEIKTAASKLAEYPAIEREVEAYRAIGDALSTVIPLQEGFSAARAASDDAKAALRSFGAALKWEKEAASQRQQEAAAEEDEARRLADIAREKAVSARVEAEGWRAAGASRRAEAARREVAAHEAERAQAVIEVEAARLARPRSRLRVQWQTFEAKQSEFKKAEALLSRELAPVYEAGDQYSAALRSRIRHLDVSRKALADRASEGEALRRELEDQARVVAGDRAGAEHALKSRDEAEAEHASVEKQMFEKGLLLPDELLGEAETRHEAALKEARAKKEEADEARIAAAGRVAEAQAEAVGARTELGAAQARRDAAGKAVLERAKAAEEFMASGEVIAVFEGGDADPRSVETRQRLDRLVAVLAGERERARASLLATEGLLAAYEAGLSTNNDNLKRALEGIRSLGVEAHPAPAYIADTLADPEKAREIVESNPGRMYHGILVYDEASLDKVRAADHSAWALVEPVEVSLVNHEVAPARGYSHSMLKPVSIGAYHGPTREAEKKKLRDEKGFLERRLGEIEKQQGLQATVKQRLEEILSAERILPSSRLDEDLAAATEAVFRREALLAEAEAALEAAQRGLVAAKEQGETAARNLDEAHARSRAFDGMATKLRGIGDRLASMTPRAALEKRLAELSQRIGDLSRRSGEAARQAEEDRNNASSLSRQLEAARERHIAIKFRHDLENTPEYGPDIETALIDAEARYLTLEKGATEGDAGFRELKRDIDSLQAQAEDAKREFAAARAAGLRTANVDKEGEAAFDAAVEEMSALSEIGQSDCYTQAVARRGEADAAAQKAREAAKEAETEARVRPVHGTVESRVREAATNIDLTAAGMDEAGCITMMEASHSRAADGDRAAAAHGTAMQEAGRKKAELQKWCAVLDVEIARLEKPAGLTLIAPAHAEVPKTPDALRLACHSLLSKEEAARGEVVTAEKALKDARRRFSKVASEISARADGTHAAGLIDRLKEGADAPGEWNVRSEDVERIAEARKAKQHELEYLNPQKDEVTRRLADVLHKAVNTFKAALRARVPDGAGRFAGAVIMKCAMPFNDVQDENIRQAARLYFEGLIQQHSHAADGISIDGLRMMVALLKELARQMGHEEYKFRILVPVVQARENTYHEMSNMVGSGGQILTAAFLLYLVLAACRTAADNAGSIFLLLDNPLGVASAKDLVETQISVADKLNIQILAFTSIAEVQAISCFDRITQLHLSRGRKMATVQNAVVEDDVWNASFELEPLPAQEAVH